MTGNPAPGHSAAADVAVRTKRFGNSLTLLVILALAVVGALGSALSQAQPQTPEQAGSPRGLDRFPDIQLPEQANGDAAIAALGAKLPELAAFYGKSPGEFASLLRSDLSLWIDRRGRALYIEPDSLNGPVAADPSATADLLDSTPYPLSQTFQLQSKPDAPRTIYLDFDGHVTEGTAWNASYNVETIISPAYDRDSDPSTFSDSELREIQRMWRQVAEDFAPFDVNVTTADPGQAAITRSGSGDNFYGTRVVITRDNFAGCGCGGFAYLRAFDDASDYYKPAFVFNGGVKGAGEAITHEVGHNLGLNHDGVTGGSAYYSGHGSGETGWAPIMGVGYNRNLVQWSAGEYAGANNQEDDLARMQTYGAPLLPDDHGDTPAQATDVETTSDGVIASISSRGRIGTRSDRDSFRFFAGAGDFSVQALPVPDAPNIDLQLTLRSSSGTELASDNGSAVLAASLSGTLSPGEYFLEVTGVGKGDVSGTGYSDYASLGYYQVSGTVADPAGLAPPVAVASAPGYGSDFGPLYVAFDGSGSVGAASWSWDFGDGSGAGGRTVNHTFNAPGDYTVTLTVTSEAGLTDSDSLTVQVRNRDPVARFMATPDTGTAPVVVAFDGSGSSDDDTVNAPSHGIVSYLWDFGDGSSASGRVVSHEYTEAGPFTATLTVTDDLGGQGSVSATLDIAPPPFSDHVANGEATSAGTVTGSYIATHSADGAVQVIRERESGGRKSSRYSYLEHRWYLDLPAGDSAMLSITGSRENSSDGDEMEFFYQLGNGQETPLPITLGENSSTLLASLPSVGGALALIVRDNNRTPGNRSLDAVRIDEITVRVSNSGGGDGGGEVTNVPAAPRGLSAEVPDASTVTLTWSDNADNETGFEILRGTVSAAPAVIATVGADVTSYTDNPVTASTTYDYLVRAFNAAGSSDSDTISVTTPASQGIVLSGSGSKVKGVKTVTLSWEGIEGGNLYRNGNLVGQVSSGSFSETLGKGGGSYVYQLCANGDNPCSNLLEIIF